MPGSYDIHRRGAHFQQVQLLETEAVWRMILMSLTSYQCSRSV
jgi:hypothetical protein